MWHSKTRQFGAQEIGLIETQPALKVGGYVIGSTSIVGLRILAELLLHDDERLNELLRYDEINKHWRQYTDGPFKDERDDDYAQQLEAKILELQQKGK